MARDLPPEYMASLYERFCEARDVHGLPIKLMTTKIERWDLGKHCISGWDEDKMAMWSEAFYGGRLLARHILGNPSVFRGKNVVDIGSGSGVVAIAAAMVGAHVTAVDSSPCAYEAIKTNAALNNVTLEVVRAEACRLYNEREDIFDRADIITAADIFYTHRMRSDLVMLLSELASCGKIILATSQDEDLRALFSQDGMPAHNITSHKGGFAHFAMIEKGQERQVTTTPARTAAPARPLSYSRELRQRFATARLRR